MKGLLFCSKLTVGAGEGAGVTAGEGVTAGAGADTEKGVPGIDVLTGAEGIGVLTGAPGITVLTGVAGAGVLWGTGCCANEGASSGFVSTIGVGASMVLCTGFPAGAVAAGFFKKSS